MTARKKLLAFMVIICLTTLYLNFGYKEVNTDDVISKHLINDDEDNINTPLVSYVSPKDLLINSKVKVSEDIGIFECLPDLFLDEEARNKNINQFFQSLSNYSSKDSALHYALYATPVEGVSKIGLLFDYHKQFPSNPIVSKDLISLCINSTDQRCTTNFIKSAVATDSKNGAVWTNVISFYASKANDEAVFNSIESLTKTAFFNERYGEKALLFAHALAGSTESNFNINANAGLQKAYASYSIYSPIITWCKNSLKEYERADACLMLGEHLETSSKSILSKSVGITLQKIVFETRRDIDAVKLMEIKSKGQTSNLQSKPFLKASIMLMLDERLLRSWLNNLDLYGELESQQLLTEEALVLYEKNENQLCTLIYDVLDILQ